MTTYKLSEEMAWRLKGVSDYHKMAEEEIFRDAIEEFLQDIKDADLVDSSRKILELSKR